jgi:hypothetical protein
MKKLENYGVQELNTKEAKDIDGGGLPNLWDVYFWLWSKAEAVGPQNPGANGYMGCKL